MASLGRRSTRAYAATGYLTAFVIGPLIHEAFLTTGNILNILQHSSELAVVVMAL